MVLSAAAIKKGIAHGLIGIDPFTDAQIEAAHVNLHLGEVDAPTNDGVVSIKAKGFVLARTEEKIMLSASVCGIIEGRSRLARRGVSIEQSSTLIEPGTNSQMTLEIFNASDVPVELHIGKEIAKMVLFKITDEI